MATMAMDMVRIKSLSVLSLVCLLPQISTAGEWEFSPDLFVDEIYTDNVELTKANKIDSLVSQIGLALNTHYKAQYLSFDLSSSSTYAMYSHDHEIDDDFHTLNSQVNYMLWPNGIIFTASAGITNQSRNAARNGLADIVSGNTVQIENYNSGFAYNVANSDFTIDSSIQYQITQSEDNIGEREGYVASLASNNGKSARNVFWNITGSYQDTENNNRDSTFYQTEIKLGWISGVGFNPFIRYYDEDNEGANQGQRSLESNSVGLGIRWLATPRLFFDISYNKPIGDELTIDGEVQDNYFDYSMNWQPTQRTTLSAGYSQRFYGDSYQLALKHENKRLTNTISYSEAVQTFTRNNFEAVLQGIYLCPTGELNDFSDCYITNNQNIDPTDVRIIPIYDFELVEDYGLSLNKSLSWSSTLSLPRTTFSLNINGNERENLETRLIDTTKSANFNISRDLSPKSTLKLSLSYTEQEFESNLTVDRSNQYRQASLDYNRKLNEQLNATITISSLNRDSEQLYLNYDENRISFKVTKGF
ncbi:TIGR03016 family PEP-CTERM system-associated outer membrane protein [Thalassotalea piscium]